MCQTTQPKSKLKKMHNKLYNYHDYAVYHARKKSEKIRKANTCEMIIHKKFNPTNMTKG